MNGTVSSETLISIAKTLGIQTFGKNEEEIKKSVLEIITSKKETSAGEFKIGDLARSIGRMMGEYERMRNDLQRSFIQVQEEVKAPVSQAENEIQRSITQTREDLKAPLIQASASVEKILGIARTLDLDIRGKTIADVQKEIKKVLGI